MKIMIMLLLLFLFITIMMIIVLLLLNKTIVDYHDDVDYDGIMTRIKTIIFSSYNFQYNTHLCVFPPTHVCLLHCQWDWSHLFVQYHHSLITYCT